MAEQLQMDLRPKRRPYRYRGQDEQDPDNANYYRPNYLKMSTTPIVQQYVSPSVVLNQNAKILVKFITKANKSIRDMRLMKQQMAKDRNKKQSNNKDRGLIEASQNPKKLGQTSKNQKLQSQKKSKDLYNFKEIHQNSELIKNLSQQQLIKGAKNLQNLSGLINNKGIYSGQIQNQLSQLQSLYPNIKELNFENLSQNPNPNLFQFNDQQNPKAPTKNNNNSVNKPPTIKPQASKPKVQPKKESEKVFKRAAYHVAIAYHIYLKQLSEQGITSGNLIDPTYRARLVKQQAGMGNEEQ